MLLFMLCALLIFRNSRIEKQDHIVAKKDIESKASAKINLPFKYFFKCIIFLKNPIHEPVWSAIYIFTLSIPYFLFVFFELEHKYVHV